MQYQLADHWRVEEIARIVGGRYVGEGGMLIRTVAIDSREKVTEGGMFVAIKGERMDGHDFIPGALANGFGCVLVREGTAIEEGKTAIFCRDTQQALGDFASAIRERYNPFLVGITGSVGKTTTKQFIAALLARKFSTHRTEGNLNNQIGVPLTLLGLNGGHEAAVLEMGMSAKGEIARLSQVASPDLAVITNVGSSHIEYLGSREGIRDAKMEITTGLREGGRLFLNGDEPLLAGIEGAIYTSFERSEADIFIRSYRTEGGETLFDARILGQDFSDVRIPAIGRHNVYNAAVAAGVGLIMGMNGEEIRAGLADFVNTGLRQKISRRGDVTVIEDCYNASPESMSSALNVLKDTAVGRKIAVLGDMRELGSHTERLHRQVGALAVQTGVDVLVTFGESALDIAEGAAEAGLDRKNIRSFADLTDPKAPAEALRELLCPGDTLLFKASRGVEMERIIPILFDERGC